VSAQGETIWRGNESKLIRIVRELAFELHARCAIAGHRFIGSAFAASDNLRFNFSDSKSSLIDRGSKREAFDCFIQKDVG
jgi:hypothetical protein